MKTFLSIGTGPGIGITTAKRFAAEGFKLILTARNKIKLDELVQQSDIDAQTYALDASDAGAVASLIKQVETEFGSIDVLHYNAANLRNETLAQQPLNTFNSDLAVNIGGAMAAAQAVSVGMSAAKSGTILLTGGGFALAPHPEFLSISIGKAGIRALAQGLFDDYKGRGIHVATVTVAGFVNAGTKQVTEIAESFWLLHSQTPNEWTVETVYQP